MKLHLPVRLFRAVIALMAVAMPFSASAAQKYTVADGQQLTLSGSDELVLDISGYYVSPSSGSAYGGAIYATGTGSVTIEHYVSVLFNENYAKSSSSSSSSYYACGGAIYSESGDITLSGNESVTFSGNYASSYASSSSYYPGARGGAIYSKSGAITLSGNESVTFSGNYASSYASHPSARGGAIYSESGDITLSGNESVTFSGNYAASANPISVDGGAIYSESGAITLSGNGSVTFSDNLASANHSARGGAIYSGSGAITLSGNGSVTFSDNLAYDGGAIYSSSGDITLSGNESVTFSDNLASSSSYAHGGAIYSSRGDITLSGNESVTFSGNYAKSASSSAAYAYGGAIYSSSGDITLSRNESVTFSGNYAAASSYAYGGAIYSKTGAITLSGNGSVTFSGNYASSSYAYGGAIYSSSGDITLSGNESVTFSGNYAASSYAYGGAIFGKNIGIRDNGSVVFKQNYEKRSGTYRLRGLYATGNTALSSANGNYIEFQESMYVGGVLELNNLYTNDAGQSVAQTGDIIFTGAYTEEHIEAIKSDYTEEELRNSQTSDVAGMTTLYDGRLIVRNSAILSGVGLTVASSASGYSTPTVLLENAKLNHAGATVSFASGTHLEASGESGIDCNNLTMRRGSALTLHAARGNKLAAVLSVYGSFTMGDSLTLNISFNDDTAEDDTYKLLQVNTLSNGVNWTSDKITVNGLDGFVVSFDDLEWKDNTLYLNYNGTPGTGGSGSTTPPSLLIATWTNEAKDGMWNSTSLNWEQDEVDYAYVDGVQVVFGDEGAGTVTLVGDIAPSSVLVDSAEDYTWNADETEGGKLTGDMTLTKKGEGKLTINSENDYTGGTSILGGTVVAGSTTALGDGVVNLTNATLEIAAKGVSNALTTAGTSSILVQDDGLLTLKSAISNAASGILTLSGKVDVSGIGELTKLDATLIDVNGNAGESGFARAEGYTLQVVNGGKVLGSGAELVHSGLPTGLTLVLGENGLAMAGAATDFTKYVVAGSHAVSVSEILKDVPTDSTLSTIEMTGGTLLVDAATDALSASAGTVTVTRDVELGGTMSGGMLLAQAGEIAATLSGNTSVVANGTVTLSGNNSHTGGVILNGGSLTLEHANALGTGQLVTSGISSLVIDSGVELALGQAISNSGTLSISGNIQAKGNLNTVAATRVDVNGNNGTSGFAKDALEWVQIVNGGTTVNAGAAVSHESATGSLVLSSDGRATCGGEIHYNEYLLTGTGVADVQSIKDAAGSELTGIRMEGGTLTVGTDTAGLLTATDGIIILEAGGKLGADSSISGVDIKATGGSIASTLNDSNTLEGIGNFALDAVIANNGTLVLSGTIKADALSLVEEQASTFVDVNGNSGASGFAQSSQMSVQLTHGTGNTIDGGVTITHKDATGTLILGANGKAGYGGDVDYTHYLLNGIDDKASVSGIIADAGDALNTITVQQGTLTVDAVTKPVTATGGTVVLDGGVLNGELTDTALTLKNGSLGTVSITGGAVTGDGYQLSSVLNLNGNVSISGSFNASALQLDTTHATRIDVNNQSGASGFYQADAYMVQLINGGILSIADGTEVKHGSLNLVLGADGYATAGGGIIWSEYLLTGDDSATASAILQKANDNGYSGTVAINQSGGTLTVDTNAGVNTSTGNIILTGGTLSGTISGATINASAGTLSAALSGNNSLVGQNFALSGVLTNSGTLTMSGTFSVNTLTTNEAATYIGADGLSGFAKEAYKVATIAMGTTADAGATIKYGDETLKLNTNGTASLGGKVDYSTFWLQSDVSVASDAIHTMSSDALVDITSGHLTVNDETRVNATGGSIELTTGGVLNGSLTNTELTLTAGAVNASINGGKVIGNDYALSEVLQVSGNVSISGSFVADNLVLNTIDEERVDVVTGNSGNSGFLLVGGHSVQIINGGTLDIAADTTVSHGALELTLESNGFATTGRTMGHEYLLIGNDTVNVGAILAKDSSATINMQGGTLTVDAATNKLTATAGTINLNSNVELGGSISGVTINASTGTLSAALSGNNSLVGQNFALSGVLTNSGTLTMSGTFSVNSLTTNEAATYIGADGLSGFAKEAYKVATIATGITADAGATIKYGDETLKLNTDGTASLGGKVDYSTFWLQSDVSVASDAIHTLSSNALVDITSGHLTVNDETLVKATGGSIELTTGGVLNGSLSNTELTLSAGTVNATISGGKVMGNDYALSEVLQVSGNVSISGSFVADNLVLNTIDEERVDVVTGNSGNSGFLLVGGHSVQIINGGTLDIAAGTAVSHGSLELTLGSNGFATTGRTMGHEYLLIGNDAVNVGAILAKDSSATINMQSGTLTVDAATNKLTATAGTINLNSNVELGGSISGATINASAGTLAAALSGNNSLVGQNFALSGVLTNSGTLTMSGTFSVNSLTTNEAATYIGADGLSGFAKEAYKVATIAMGTTADAGATIKYGDETLKLNTDGTASTGGKVDYSTFWLQSDVSVASDAIHTMSSDALVDITSGHLTVNDETRVKATGGSIELTTGGVLNGSLSNIELTLTAGTVNATISGGKVMGNDYALSEVLQVSGNVSISGSFVADNLVLNTIDEERVDVVTGNSGNSGFLLSEGHSVQIINGGTLDIASGTTVTHGALELTLGSNGFATTGRTMGHEYLLIGNDTVNVGAILAKDSSATINMQGGTLTVDAATNALTATAGTISLNSNVELGGTISGATINASSGTLSVALSGNNTLVGNAFALNGTLTNSGTLTMSGTFSVNSLTTNEAATYIGADGLSGFAKEAYKVATIATGITADAGATIKFGDETLKLNTDGTASTGGEVDYSTFWLQSDTSVESDDIHTMSANALVDITSGHLTVNDEARVNATGGSIELTTGGALNGSLTNTELTLTAGAVNASISGGKVMGNDYALSEVLQVSGNVSISGSFNASALQLVTEGESRVDVVTGNSGNSGFLKLGDSYVQLFNGGTVSIEGVKVSHQDAVTTLTLGSDGYARSTGGTNYNEYLLTGSDRVSTQLIHFGAGAGAKVRQEGGQLTVNDETTVKTTNGEIVLTGANLLGEVFDARVTAESGCIAATLGGITAVTITGDVSMSGNNFHSGITTLADGSLTISHANALGSGDLITTGESKLTVDGVTLALSDAITNTGKLTLSGSIDASALQLNKTEAGRLSLSGERVGLTESGFSQGVEYTVLIVDGGSTVNAGAGISHKDYLSRTQLVLGEDGVARAGAEVDYTHFFLTGGDSAEVSKIAEVSTRNQVELNGVTMDSGLLTVDQSITVSATGGSLVVTDAATLGGAIDNATVSTAAEDYTAEIAAALKGTTSLEIAGGTITVSGDNSYTGGTEVNGGTLVAGSDTAFGSGDVAVNDGGTLDLGACTIANLVLLSGEATLAHADGASNILLQSGANAGFANGFELSEGKSLTVGAGMAAFVRSRAARVGGTVYRGALTLGGGELTLNEHLTVEGHVSFGAGTTTIVNVAGWQGAEAGTELAIFNSNSGYTMDSLTLRGAATGLVLNFNASTGVLSLVAAQQPLPPAPPPVLPEFAPDLNRNQQEVYDTVKDIVAGGEKPEGELGKLVELISGSRNEAELRELLDAVGGSEYATLMSNQLDGNLAHLRNLRNRMGSGWELVGNNYMRAMIEMFGQHNEVDGDAHGRGYTRSEMGGQFTLEFIGCMHMSSGVALASGHTRLTPDKAMRQSVNNNYVDFYTTYRSHGHCNMGYSAKFSLGIGTHDYNLRRNVLGTPTKADTDGFSLNFMHESAYTVRLSQGSSLQIFGVVESSFSRVKGFREKGAGTASLVMETQDAWATDITLGLRYVQMLDSFALPQATLTLQTGVTAGVGDTTAAAQLHFAGAPRNRYYQTGADRNRWGYNLGVGLHVPVSDTSAFYMNGETILRGDSAEWNANVGFQIAF